MPRRIHKISKYLLGKYAVKMLRGLVCFKISFRKGLLLCGTKHFVSSDAGILTLSRSPFPGVI